MIKGHFKWKVGEVGMNYNCENCGWSKIVGSQIMCNYNEHITWHYACCDAWKPKEKETNMVEVVRCKDCEKYDSETGLCANHVVHGNAETWFCADGERK